MMVALLLFDVSLVEVFANYFDVSENSASTCVVEESTHPSYCVIVMFAAKFALSDALIMAAVRERLLLVGGSYT